MKRLVNLILNPVILLIGFILIINLNGCSVFGYGMGSLIEKSAPEAWDVTGSRLDSLDLGTWLTIETVENIEYRGGFGGFTTVNDESYKSRYQQLIETQTGNIRLPGYGERVTVATTLVRDLRKEKYNYCGFEFDYPPSIENIMLRLKKPGSDRMRLMRMNRVVAISDEIDREYHPDAFVKLVASDNEHILTAVVLNYGSKTIRVPLDSITHVGVLDVKTSAINLATIGAIFDSVIFFTFLVF